MKTPETTATIENPNEINAVSLNPLPYIIAVTFGITKRDEINKTPTSWIDVTTVMPARNITR